MSDANEHWLRQQAQSKRAFDAGMAYNAEQKRRTYRYSE